MNGSRMSIVELTTCVFEVIIIRYDQVKTSNENWYKLGVIITTLFGNDILNTVLKYVSYEII